MNKKADVALAVMPFAPIHSPSIGIGLLHAVVSRIGFSCQSLYFGFEFAKLIGPQFYDQISNADPYRWDLAGEWIFNGQLFDEASLDIDGYVRDVLYGHSSRHRTARDGIKKVTEDWVSKVLHARSVTAPFMDSCTAAIAALEPKVVGLMSIFQQHVPALALAKRLRQALPESFIVIGGSNCEGPMGAETARSFPFLDVVVSGEADEVFPELVRRIMRSESIDGLKGVFCTPNGATVHQVIQPSADEMIADPVQDLDSLPWPDYTDYFEQLKQANVDFSGVPSPQLVFETARGCWWAQKSQCTFCGLNGSNIAFRAKSAERAFAELQYLVRRFPGRPVVATDRILDRKYLKSFLPMLRDSELEVSLYYEVKANLKKDDVRLLRDAGVSLIQPGIESLSTDVLRTMKKGVTGIQNVQLLKWCTEIGLECSWYVLWGFPWDKPEEYRWMAELVPSLVHLMPPERAVRIRLDRFSPHYVHAEHFGFRGVAPFPAYEYVYPLPRQAVENLAYFFTHDGEADPRPPSYIERLIDALAGWRQSNAEAGLFYLDKSDHIIIFDLRPAAAQPVYLLDAIFRSIYLECDSATSLNALAEAFIPENGSTILEGCLKRLVNAALMMREGHRYLSLAVNLEEFQPSARVLERLGGLLDRGVSVLDRGILAMEGVAGG